MLYVAAAGVAATVVILHSRAVAFRRLERKQNGTNDAPGSAEGVATHPILLVASGMLMVVEMATHVFAAILAPPLLNDAVVAEFATEP
jgi:hypothetical protein